MKKILFIVLITILVVIIGFNIFNSTLFGKDQELRSISETVALDDAKMVDVVIRMGLGKIVVSDGTEHLMDGEFNFDNRMYEPKIKYKQSGEIGSLNVSQKKATGPFNFSFFGSKNVQNEWIIELNDQIPIDLQIESGVGKSELNLKNLNLNNLVIETGVGETLLDLNGAWQASFDVEINTGIGRTKIILPEGIGIKLKATKGIGSLSIDGFIKNGDDYINPAYETSDIKININLEMGIGEVVISN